MNKEVKIRRSIEERNKVTSEQDNIVRIEVEEESYSSSSMSMHSIESNKKGLDVSSPQSPTLLEVQITDKHEEVPNSLTTNKNPSERYSIVQ